MSPLPQDRARRPDSRATPATGTGLFVVTFALAGAALAGRAAAQCSLECTPLGQVPDADDAVYASCAWDPDGAGPQPALVVFGGAFQVLGNVVCRGIVAYDPATGTCTPLGTGISGGTTASVLALHVAPNNELIAGGTFTAIGGVAANHIARWNGSTWQALGAGVPLTVAAATTLQNGDLVAGGLGSPSVLRWNGTAWAPLGSGTAGIVLALAAMPNGDVVAGGSQVLPGSVASARWDGTAWTPFAGNIAGTVRTLLPLPNGELVAGGGFVAAGGVAAASIARWNGATWSAFGSGIPGQVHTVARAPNGDLIAAGEFGSAGGIPANQIARWDGTAWSALGPGLGVASPYVRAVHTVHTLANGAILAGGAFRSPTGDADHVARWNGTAWTQLRPGIGGAVLCSADTANGDLLVGGDFTTIEGVPAARVARRISGVWQPLGAGVNGSVQSILPLPNGEVVIGGAFTTAGGVAASRVARWDGASWHALAGGLPGAVRDLALGPSGQILASGTFLDAIAMWNGQAWQGTGASPPYSPRKLLVLPGGDVLAAVGHPSAAVSRWDGVQWVPLTGPGAWVGTIAVANGVLHTGSGSGVTRWTGSSWNMLPGSFNGEVTDLVGLPDGGLLAGGSFTATASGPKPHLARWNGTAWSAVGAGASQRIDDLRWRADGRVVVAGAFQLLLGTACGSVGEIGTTCPAASASAGAGCSGSGGANVLVATSLPWLGGTFTSVATGLPANALAVEVRGLGALAQPLAALLPQGIPGCVLSTSPDLLALHVPSAGPLALELAVPSTPSLVGATFRQQVVPFELATAGAIAAVTATNSLQLTIGRF